MYNPLDVRSLVKYARKPMIFDVFLGKLRFANRYIAIEITFMEGRNGIMGLPARSGAIFRRIFKDTGHRKSLRVR